MKVCSLASSSKGNCTIVYNENQILIVDMGIPYKEFLEKLQLLGLDIDNVIGAVVSHEHCDHIKGLLAFYNATGKKIFCHYNSVDGIIKKIKISKSALVRFDSKFELGDFVIDPFEVSHDVFCVGFNIYENSNKISIVTDLGYTTNVVVQRLYDSRLVILEANHDEKMVMTGKYPPILKSRILSKKGHLSNTNSAKVVAELAQHNVKQIVFGHLSEENNTPQVCYDTIAKYLESVGIEPQVNIKLDIAKPHGVGPIYVVK
ncbi:MAG: MBL fold metallo-hydrolase [Firmicutes bacterium]|nr:MBL fold metallo-hydrolase [Bacillota bacterium]MDY5676659.1 MBL fold metallo-hydrolase [Eubacteriales bacterium]